VQNGSEHQNCEVIWALGLFSPVEWVGRWGIHRGRRRMETSYRRRMVQIRNATSQIRCWVKRSGESRTRNLHENEEETLRKRGVDEIKRITISTLNLSKRHLASESRKLN
jgi:hypothetical protein